MKEKILIAIAWRLPRSLVYWCAVRVMTYATQGQNANMEVSQLNAIDGLNRWRLSLSPRDEPIEETPLNETNR
jgi:hypothetical protein